MKQEIIGIEALNAFLEPLLKGEWVVGAQEIEPNKFVVEWEPRKKYIARDGTEHLEEVWVTLDKRMIQIQDLTEDHAKNILRMILRQRRETELALAQLQKLYGILGNAPEDGPGDIDLDLSAFNDEPKNHLH